MQENIYFSKFFTSHGPHLRKVIEVSEYEGTPLTHCNAVEFKSARIKLLEQMETALEKRFVDFSQSHPGVILSTKIADITTWPKSWDTLKGFQVLKNVNSWQSFMFNRMFLLLFS